MFLLDTGVVFAAVVQAHSHHGPVSQWLGVTQRYATCGLTQIGAFRLLLTNAAMHGFPLDSATAHEVLADFTSNARHAFVPCPAISRNFVGQTPGSKAAFDDYLVQIAHTAGCKLATLDRSLSSRWPERTLLIAQE